MNTNQTEKLASISDADLTEQTANQYKAVIHMARSMLIVHEQTLPLIPGQSRGILEIQCVQSAEIMEVLGDLLNAMDAVDEEEDGWIGPIFEKSHEVFGDHSAQRWTRVEDGLPEEDGQEVWIYRKGVVHSGFWRTENTPHFECGGNAWREDSDVTHWMSCSERPGTPLDPENVQEIPTPSAK